jgi:Amidohydrolase family
MSAETIIYDAKIATNGVPSFVEAIAIEGGKVTAAGNSDEMLRLGDPATTVIDAKGRSVIPGLNDSHMHPIRGGLNYNMELRWAARTPAPQWVRVIGGWTEFQFAERRMPTLDEINAVAPDTPVFVLRRFVGRLFLHSGRRDQTARIGAHHCRRENRICHRRILKTGASCASSESGLVACQRVWRVREGFEAIAWRFPFCCVFPCSGSHKGKQQLAPTGAG